MEKTYTMPDTEYKPPMQELIEMQKETNELLKTLLAEVKEVKEIWKNQTKF